MTTTCDRCLEGRHRCLTLTCACTCRGPVRRQRPAPGNVLRTPRPTRPPAVARTPQRPTPFQLIQSRAFAAEVARLEDVIHG